MWVKSTSDMINILVLVPTIVVVMLGPEFSFWPLRLQVMVTGMSPLHTTQVNWAKSPESVTGFPNVKGIICGGSKKKHWLDTKMQNIFPVPCYVTHSNLPLTFNSAE